MDLLYTITHASRIHDTKFCRRVGGEGEFLLVAAEDHKLSVYDIPKEDGTPKIVAEMVGHTNRSAFFIFRICQIDPYPSFTQREGRANS